MPDLIMRESSRYLRKGSGKAASPLKEVGFSANNEISPHELWRAEDALIPLRKGSRELFAMDIMHQQ